MGLKHALQRGLKRVTSYSDRWWFAPLLAFLSALDAYIVVIPNDPLVAAGAFAQPKKWLSLSVWMTIGNALGAVSVAALIAYESDWIWGLIVPHESRHSHTWTESLHLVRDHGFWGLTLISLSPLPQHAAVIIAGLIEMPLKQVFFAVTLGRGVKYAGIAYLAAKAPDKLRKWRLLPP